MKPLKYDLQRKYPIVICLHHGGACGNDNIKQIDGSEPAQLLSKNENRVKYASFIFVSQCPSGSSWGGMPEYPSVDSLVFETINALEKEYTIDTDRCYVMGISMGGYGTWNLISTHPKMFAAAIPICGAGDTNLVKNVINVPLWAFHGRLDRNVPVSGSRDMIGAIRNAGGKPRYTEFPDGDHNIWNQVSNTPGLLDWLFIQKRN
jgi:predicted peptidase